MSSAQEREEANYNRSDFDAQESEEADCDSGRYGTQERK
jgi:hypothetical protein